MPTNITVAPEKVGIREATRTYLTALFGHKPPQTWILIWEITAQGEKISHWAQTVADAVAAVADCPCTSNVYVEMGLGARKGDAHSRIPALATVAITTLWLDLDYGKPEEGVHKKGNLPPTQADALRILDLMPVPPTLVVCSGYGLHAYYSLREPLVYSTESERTQVSRLTKTWEEIARTIMRTFGWEIDAIADLARVLRAAGTYNMKLPDSPVEATILQYDPDATYGIETFAWEKLAPYQMSTPLESVAAPPTNGTMASHTNGTTPPSPPFPVALPPISGKENRARFPDAVSLMRGIVLNADAAIPHDVIEAFKATDRRVGPTLARTRKDFAKEDYSPSGYDMALANLAVQAGWEPQQIVNLLIMQRRTHGDDLKLDYPAYYGLTVLNAQAVATLTQHRAEQEHHSSPPIPSNAAPIPSNAAPPPSSEAPDLSKDELLANLSQVLGIRILEVRRMLSEPRGYVLVTDRGDVRIDNIRDLTTQRLCREKIADATAYWFHAVSKKEWDQIVVPTLLEARIDLDVSDEATDMGRIATWVSAYLDDRPPGDLTELTAANKEPFVDGDEIAIFASSLRQWLWANGERVEHTKLCNLLRQWGATPMPVHVMINGEPTTRSVWYVPVDARPHNS